MSITTSVVSTDAIALLNKLNGLDLGPIAYKLTHPESGNGWSQERVNSALLRYMRFLCLISLYPNMAFVPTKEIDRVWHHHVLDTGKYARDCQMLFGNFLHHFPYFGLRGESDRLALQTTFARTQELFEQHFGIPMTEEVSGDRSSNKPAGCHLLQAVTEEYRPTVALNFDPVTTLGMR